MRIERIPIEVSTRAPTGRTAAYLLGGEDALLVDPAAPDGRLEAALDRVDDVAVTHHHADHVGGVRACAEAADATVWCRYGREAAFADAAGVDPDRTFREGGRIPAGDGAVTVHETPGHAPEHVAFAVDGDLLVGDLAVTEGSVVVGAPEGDMRSYLSSLRRVRAMAPERLYPGHGPVAEAPRSVCERLLRRRLDREARVLAAVEAGDRAVADILDSTYDRDLAGVRDLAGMTVRAHLDKLHHEGRVEWDGSRADPA
ncbi:beta-lactamase domain protein [Natronomonas moolapensis 8.8.11]|uniref:Beta-lactamase domain protein n=1 Tax=Natronomonas moolapensis (strain DSM 18674 / CECT 7526 / JCM 14361 / 8.8.11) TaxID=268739 RepID=M1XQ66_NATM8|nr:MBL fold metallo-hydrolase [Natronomonas moolapensis]CCQ36258.1 beta-lactamase domain protein [Natronomonas moolapensis 8.8.11]